MGWTGIELWALCREYKARVTHRVGSGGVDWSGVYWLGLVVGILDAVGDHNLKGGVVALKSVEVLLLLRELGGIKLWLWWLVVGVLVVHLCSFISFFVFCVFVFVVFFSFSLFSLFDVCVNFLCFLFFKIK